MSTAIAVWCVFCRLFTRGLTLKWRCRSVVVNPGTRETVVPPPDIQIHVKGISLGAELKDKDGRSSLKLSYQFVTASANEDDEDESEDAPTVTREVVLGSLTPGKVNHVFLTLSGFIIPLAFHQIEQATVDLVLDEEDEYVFEVIGKKWRRSLRIQIDF